MEQTPTTLCGCGCGFRLTAQMYGFNIRGRWYAQGCVGRAQPVVLDPADTNPAPGPDPDDLVVAA